MSEIQKTLEKKGWFLTPEAIKQCSQEKKNSTADSIINTALDLDIRGLLQKSLPDGIGRSTANKVPFPRVLQIVKVTNVAAPTSNQESQTAPPLLRIHVTDGFSTCCALDIANIQGLSLKTFPGAKICLKAEVKVRNGMILLTNENAKFLGGKVEKLIRKVKANQAMIKTSSGDGSSGPPPFIPFQEYIKNNPKVNKQASDNYNAKGSGKSSMESRGNNRPERFQNKNTESSRSKSDDKSQNWRDRSNQSSHQPQAGASGKSTSRSANDMRHQNKAVEGSNSSQGATNRGKMALWEALDKQLDLKGTDKGNDRQAGKHRKDGFGDRYADVRSDNSRYQSEPARGRGFRDRPHNPSSTSRQPSQQLYQPPVPHNQQAYQQNDDRGSYRGGYPSRARGRGRANFQNRW